MFLIVKNKKQHHKQKVFQMFKFNPRTHVQLKLAKVYFFSLFKQWIY